jgi:hypothetical protein
VTQNSPAISREVASSRRFLDCLREGLDLWSASLFDVASGGFRQSHESDVDLLSSTDVVWMRYAANSADAGAPDRSRIVAYLRGAQDPVTGRISYQAGGQGHNDGHAFWMTVRALAILGGQIAHFPAHLQPMMTAEGLAAWFDSIDWVTPGRSHHHDVLGLVPVVVSEGNLAEVFLQKIGEQQDPATGAWPRNDMSISRTFAYTAIHRAAGKLPRMADAIVDNILRLQKPSGIWEEDLPGYNTMDSAYVLVRLPRLIGHREAEATVALQRLSAAMRLLIVDAQRDIFANPHRLLAVTHTFGLLQEAFPDEYPSERPYRFDWDKLEMFQCDVIR